MNPCGRAYGIFRLRQKETMFAVKKRALLLSSPSPCRSDPAAFPTREHRDSPLMCRSFAEQNGYDVASTKTDVVEGLICARGNWKLIGSSQLFCRCDSAIALWSQTNHITSCLFYYRVPMTQSGNLSQLCYSF